MGVFDPVSPVPPLPATPDILQIGLPDPNLVPYDPGTLFLTFNRAWLVTFISLFSGVVAYDSLRTVFEIEKTALPTANKGKISLYNLNDLSRADYLKGGQIALALGYGGAGAPVIPLFTNADIWRVYHERKGPDIISTFESGEGEKNLQESFFNASFPAGTPAITIIEAIVAAMGLVNGPVVGADLSLPYNFGQALSGSCSTLLNRIIVKELGLRWWVDGFFLNIAAPGVPAKTAVVPVNETTGMIGTPNIAVNGQGGDNVLTFTSLINCFLVPGTAVAITSKFITAVALIKKSKFKGDTHGSDWTVTCECTPITALTSGLNFAGLPVTQV